MKQSHPFVFSTGVIGYPILFVLTIWTVFWVEVTFGFDFNHFGIQPRTWIGLRGIFFSPFIHSGMKHLFNNSVPLLVLSMALFYFYRKISWEILGYGLLLTGFLTWTIGRPANHIGASGIIYLLASFLFWKGIFSKYFRLVALSLIVVFLYGGLIWYVTPIDPNISWEGHLSGLISGFIFSLIYRKKIASSPKYEWQRPDYKEEEDEFMRHFDENGNFIESLQPQQEEQDLLFPEPGEEKNNEESEISYRYFYKRSKDQNT